MVFAFSLGFPTNLKTNERVKANFIMHNSITLTKLMSFFVMVFFFILKMLILHRRSNFFCFCLWFKLFIFLFLYFESAFGVFLYIFRICIAYMLFLRLQMLCLFLLIFAFETSQKRKTFCSGTHMSKFIPTSSLSKLVLYVVTVYTRQYTHNKAMKGHSCVAMSGSVQLNNPPHALSFHKHK